MNDSGLIELNGMIFFAHHGVMEQEQKVGNTFSVDLRLRLHLSQASRSDSLQDTVNYAEIYEITKQEMAISSKLLEHVAGRILGAIKLQYPVIESIEVRVTKKNPPIEGEVSSVSITLRSD